MIGRTSMVAANSLTKKTGFVKAIKRYKYLYLLLIPGAVMLVLFRYVPMYGVIMAFEDFKISKGFFGSEWVWFENFYKFFENPYSLILIRNTFLLGIYSLIFGFPIPILIALAFNEIKNQHIKNFTQTISYLPYFVSTVIIIGIMKDFLTLDTGVVNQLITSLGGKQINFFNEPEFFRPIYIFSGIWKGAGFGSIIYLAAISGINVELYESAIIDGSTRFKNVIYITIPCIAPTITVMFILAVGGILGNDFTKIILIYTGSTYETADVLQTYVYRLGIEGGNYGYSAAVGLFNSVVSFLFLYIANYMSRKVEGESLW